MIYIYVYIYIYIAPSLRPERGWLKTRGWTYLYMYIHT